MDTRFKKNEDHKMQKHTFKYMLVHIEVMQHGLVDQPLAPSPHSKLNGSPKMNMIIQQKWKNGLIFLKGVSID